MTYRAELWGMKLTVFEIKLEFNMVGVIKRDRMRNEEIRRRSDVETDATPIFLREREKCLGICTYIFKRVLMFLFLIVFQ